MSAADNKAVVRRFIEEALNRKNLAVLDDVIAPNHVEHSAPPGMAPGPEGLRQAIAMMLSVFPDLQVTIEDQLADGDRVASRYTNRATHASGTAVTWSEIDVVRVVDGKIVERWYCDDQLGLLQQLGLAPAPGT